MDAVTFKLAKKYTDEQAQLKATNLIINGDFSDGTTSWSSGPVANIKSVVDGYFHSEAPDKPYIAQWGNWQKPIGTKFYVRFNGKASKNGVVNLGLSKGSYFSSIDTANSVNFSLATTDSVFSAIITNGIVVGGLRFNTTTFGTAGDYIEVKNVLLIDLTETFGVGNEPTLSDMDKIMSYIEDGWFDHDYNLAKNKFLFDFIRYKFEGDIDRDYIANIEMSGLSTAPNINSNNLMLVAIKHINIAGYDPKYVGYLYLDETTQKLYYSDKRYDNPTYLCDWNTALAATVWAGHGNCEYWQGFITPDGDLLFFRTPSSTLDRGNPIIYPAGDYANPIVIDFGAGTAPLSAINPGIDFDPANNFFIYGEYRGWDLADDDTPIYLWKVVKPYSNPANWSIIATYYVRHYESPEGAHPGLEISHFHTVNYDTYSGAWIATTGDGADRCKIIMSIDDGVNWTIEATGSTTYRTVGLIFTPDAVYWGTDQSGTNHKVFKVTRDVNNYPDFTTMIELATLHSGQATYGTTLVRNPYGLLFIDRAEPRYDEMLDLQFYSLDDNKLYTLGIYDRLPGADAVESEGRHGWGEVMTYYQSSYEDGIVTGSRSARKPVTLEILENDVNNLIGNTKIVVKRVR